MRGTRPRGVPRYGSREFRVGSVRLVLTPRRAQEMRHLRGQTITTRAILALYTDLLDAVAKRERFDDGPPMYAVRDA